MNADKISQIKMIVFDVDGTLTDGGIYVMESGEEMKKFNVKDGMAIARLQKKGYIFGLISGSKGQGAIRHRAQHLGIEHVYVGNRDKVAVLDEWLATLQLTPAQVLFMGDDLSDIAVMQHCGLSACPADAAGAVQQVADRITEKAGGEGCFRELADRFFAWYGSVATDPYGKKVT